MIKMQRGFPYHSDKVDAVLTLKQAAVDFAARERRNHRRKSERAVIAAAWRAGDSSACISNLLASDTSLSNDEHGVNEVGSTVEHALRWRVGGL